jgi:hypothetical protein
VNQAVTAYDTRLCSRSDALEILGG